MSAEESRPHHKDGNPANSTTPSVPDAAAVKLAQIWRDQWQILTPAEYAELWNTVYPDPDFGLINESMTGRLDKPSTGRL